MENGLEKIIRNLAAEINDVVFFVGAGISVESGSPTGNNIIRISAQQLSDRLSKNSNTDKVNELLTTRARPETLFNYFEVLREPGGINKETGIPTVQSLLQNVLMDLHPSKIHFALAALLLNQKCQMLLSLNYDSLI